MAEDETLIHVPCWAGECALRPSASHVTDTSLLTEATSGREAQPRDGCAKTEVPLPGEAPFERVLSRG